MPGGSVSCSFLQAKHEEKKQRAETGPDFETYAGWLGELFFSPSAAPGGKTANRDRTRHFNRNLK